MSNTSLSDRFINTYNELTEHMEKILNIHDYKSHVQMLSILNRKNQTVAKFYDELRLFANLRNTIVHDSTSRYNPIAEPHKEAVERYEYIYNRIKNPPTALDICIRAKDLIFASLDDRVIDCIKKMHENDISYIPIIDKNTIVGVFSGDAVFTYMRNNKTTVIDSNFTIMDLGECISLDKHIDERFEYVRKFTKLDDIVYMFSQSIKGSKRLGVIFVTENGRPHEKVLGMISPHNVIEEVSEGI